MTLSPEKADSAWGPGIAVPPGISCDLYRSLQTCYDKDCIRRKASVSSRG